MDFFEDEKIQSVIKIIEIILLLVIIGLLIFNNFFKKEPVSNDETVNEIPTKTEEKKEEVVSLPKEYKVDIKGAVKNPGVYTLKEGSIINDLLDAAGGIKSGGSLKNINLSKKVEDEMVVYIYTNNELNKLKNNTSQNSECVINTYEIGACEGSSVIKVDNSSSNSSNTSDNSSTGNILININTASVDQLVTLSGIGESKAKAIIEYREKNGSFKTIEDIMNVSGIGESSFAKIKDYITV